jgi:hypothetical protein
MNKPGIVCAIDADNLLISSAQAGQKFEGYAGFEVGFDNTFKWLRTFGQILCVHFYLSPFQRTNSESLWHVLWKKYRDEFLIESIFCPPKIPQGPLEKPDDVDAHLVYHSRHIIQLFGERVKYFCLGAGDLDYSPFVWELKRKFSIEIAFEVGSEGSFSKVYRQAATAGKHPDTGGDLVHQFWPRRD